MKGDPKTRGFSTRAIHAGQHADPATGSVTVPIYATSTYLQDELGKHKGFEYARVQNPTRFALEENVAALEGGHSGHAFASGMSAIATLMTLVKSGEHVVLDESFLELAERKGYSVLAAIGEEAYRKGLAALRAALAESVREGRPLELPAAGGTVHWFAKAAR